MKFEQYHIADPIKRNLVRLGFKRPTDIQFKAIPSILNGEDLLAVAQTGTGKTAAFAIPVIDRIHQLNSAGKNAGINCLILVPTRELAMQTGSVFREIAKKTRVKSFALYGGVEQDDQIRAIQSGLDILIATPGRMFDLISQSIIKLDTVTMLIIDEADRMLDLGFVDDIYKVKQILKRKHQTLFFSATIDRGIKKVAFRLVKQNAIRIQISPDDPVSKNVSHYVLFTPQDDKRYYLETFIKLHETDKILVFVRTRVRAERVLKAMARQDISMASLHGDKTQDERTGIFNAFRDGTIQRVVATDVSARGIDIPDIDYVINYDLPVDPENYIHRVGRTGRGTRKGIAISFCAAEEKNRLEIIEKRLNKTVEVIDLTREEFDEVLDIKHKPDLKSLLDEYANFDKKRKRSLK